MGGSTTSQTNLPQEWGVVVNHHCYSGEPQAVIEFPHLISPGLTLGGLTQGFHWCILLSNNTAVCKLHSKHGKLNRYYYA